jgi:hypothetical protein
MATADETKAAQAKAARDAETRDARTRKAEHEREQADLPGSISSDDQTDRDRREGAQAGATGEPLGNLSDKKREKVVKQREETTKVYAQVAEDAEKLREDSAKEAVKQQAKLAKEQIEEQGPWSWPDEPLPGELPPYSTAKEAKLAEAQQRKADRRSTDDDDTTSTRRTGEHETGRGQGTGE